MPDVLPNTPLSVSEYFEQIARTERDSVVKFPSLTVELRRRENRTLEAFVVQDGWAGDNVLASVRLKLIRNAQKRVEKLMAYAADRIEFNVLAEPDLVGKKRGRKPKVKAEAVEVDPFS